MMKKFILNLIGLCFLSITSAQAQSFEAVVNRNTIPEGETFVLTLELSDAKTANTPDLSALNDDFTTYSVSNSFRTSIVNGQATQSQQWNLVLMPNKTGKIVIPAIKLDTFETKPITLNVLAAGAEANTPAQAKNANHPNNRFAMSGSVDNKNPYVQEQILYTVKLTDQGGLQGEEPYFDASEDWIIKSLGAPIVNSQVINGQTIRELVFKYALFPQKSGKLIIPAARFRGFYLTKDSRSDPFARFFNDDVFMAGFGMTDVFATKNPVLLSAKAIEVEVKPAAEGTGKWWLPAKDVKLFAEFNPQQSSFKLGEAISRDIYLQAVGVIDSQLPEVKFKQVAGLKQYPEKPLVQMKVQDGQVIALEKIVNVYIPNQSGEIILPEISVPWFNVLTNKPETAKIPAQKIMVTGDAANNALALPPTTPAATPTKVEIAQPMPQVSLYMLLGGAFVLGIILCFALMRLLSRASKKPNHSKVVILAAKQNDLRVLRDALILWAKERFDDEHIFSLNDIDAKTQNKEFRTLLDKLNESLYSGATKDWNKDEFLSVFEKIDQQKFRKNENAELLPKLYK